MSAPQRHARIAAAALAVLAATERAQADAGINFSSKIGGTNLQSDGTPIDGTFAFQIGTFTGGFAPSADNTDQWLSHWAGLADAAADPAPGATAGYSTVEMPPALGMSFSGFTGSTSLDHNQPPFAAMGAVYIWGYDNRTAAGAGEWILMTSSTWGWPAGASNPPAVTFSVSDADTVILGAVDQGGVHMRTARVDVAPNALTEGYEGWLANNFPAGTLADPDAAATWGAIADPDADGLANIVEFFTATDPNDASSKRPTVAGVDETGEFLLFTFYRAEVTAGASAVIEWSPDLIQWYTDGVEVVDVEPVGDIQRVTARIPMGADDTFARLNVFRTLD